ncbi:hypothetical protein ACQPZX_44190 [Actinoplanes sp. CA-142083]|uniref:hypothetical protein n=1 Tax=Actinoplanes sp. CA-142083 TaxID=3239903 RepID=UPI003D89D4E7
MPKPTTVIHDIRVAHGDDGRRPAAMQAQAPLGHFLLAASRLRLVVVHADLGAEPPDPT